MLDDISMLDDIMKIVLEAGKKILHFYNSPMCVQKKQDDSPVTTADLVANKFIAEEIAEISSFPIVSEETYDFDKPRQRHQIFWLVDPLDGTKDFIAHNDQFTVNVALVENEKPVLGVVGLPAFRDIYYATKGGGAFKNGKRIFNGRNDPLDIIGVDSCFHSSEETRDFFKKHHISNIKKYGSSIKLCKIAEGEIDIYPRFNGTKEWDTAAGHIILNEAGGEIIDLTTNEEMIYNKPSIKNNFFLAKRKGLQI
jgi:3'(2'), 5'-bisphosphate nucleotidase